MMCEVYLIRNSLNAILASPRASSCLSRRSIVHCARSMMSRWARMARLVACQISSCLSRESIKSSSAGSKVMCVSDMICVLEA